MARRKRETSEKGLDSAAERKKLRNRMSQQAFRQRQTAYIKELESRLERAGTTENEQIARLEAENHYLRTQLTSFINKLASAQASLQHLFRLMQGTLDESKALQDDHAQINEASTDDLLFNVGEHNPSTTSSPLPDKQPSDLGQGLDTSLVPTASSPVQNSSECMSVFNMFAPENLGTVQTGEAHEDDTVLPDIITSASLGVTNQIPGVWSYNYQMGPSSYSHAITRSPLTDQSIRLSNSMFSDHISALRGCIWRKWEAVDLPYPHDMRLHKLEQSVSLMVSMFTGLTRPMAMTWYTQTKWYKHLSRFLTWQLNPTRETYARMHPKYRPSALQVTESYPPFIDWCPFASIRDKLILMHAANPRLDDIILDIASAYVVEFDLSKLVRTAHYPTPGYVRVWDITQAMGNDSTEQPPGYLLLPDEASLPAPDPAAIFQSPSYARQVFRLLCMDDIVYKLDPVILKQHPELWSADMADIMASGQLLECQSLHILSQIPPPAPLDRATLRVYRHFADWAVNVICT